MATALKVGNKVGSVAGKIGAFAWSSTCRIASATGDLGEGFIAGASDGWDEQMVKEAAKVARATAMKAALNAQLVAAREANAALPAPAVFDAAAMAQMVARAVAEATAGGKKAGAKA